MRCDQLICVVALAACNTPEVLPRPAHPPADYASLDRAPSAPTSPGAVTALERQIAAKYVAALASPELAGLDALLDEEAHFVFVGNKLDAHGVTEVRRAHDKLLHGLADRRASVVRVLVTDHTQAIEWTMTGDASGRPFGIAGIALVQTKDNGTVSDLRLYFDEAVLHAQLGGEPKSLAALPPVRLFEGPATIIEQQHTPDEARLARGASDWLDNLESHEAAYTRAMTDDVVLETRESAAPLTGQAGAHAYYKSLHRSIEDGTLDTQLLPPPLAADGFVAVEYRIVGAMRDRIAFVPNLRAPIAMYVVDVLQMRGDKIAHVWRYDDPLQILPESSKGSP